MNKPDQTTSPETLPFASHEEYLQCLHQTWQRRTTGESPLPTTYIETHHRRLKNSKLALSLLVDRFDLDAYQLVVLEYALAWEIGLLGSTSDQAMATGPVPMISDFIDVVANNLGERSRLRALFARSSDLRRHRLIEVERPEPQALPVSQLTFRLEETVTDFLVGRRCPHPKVLRCQENYQHSVTAVDDEIWDNLHRATSALDGKQGCLIALSSPDIGWAKRIAAEFLDSSNGRGLWVSVDAARRCGSVYDILELAIRDARLLGRVLVILSDSESARSALERDLPSLESFDSSIKAIVCSTEPIIEHQWSSHSRHQFRLPEIDEQCRTRWWTSAFAELPFDELGELARRFEVDHDVVVAARTEYPDDELVGLSDLSDYCRRRTRHRISRSARRVETLHRWEDLIVPRETRTKLQRIEGWMTHRRKVFKDWEMAQRLGSEPGLATLFSGPPGTGKTMAASILANRLQLDIFRVDLAAVVSKYIGETEKNLDEVFNAAQAAHAVLFFDEADALFGQRGQVTDARDRYANLEVSFLLQRMEDYGGLAILATNLEDNLDQAFSRRLQFVIRFPRPARADREKIWRNLLEHSLPLADDVDPAVLAERFPLSGGHIRNCAVDAAFLAAEYGQVTMSHLMHAVARELTKIGESLSPNDFGPYYESVRRR